MLTARCIIYLPSCVHLAKEVPGEHPNNPAIRIVIEHDSFGVVVDWNVHLLYTCVIIHINKNYSEKRDTQRQGYVQVYTLYTVEPL